MMTKKVVSLKEVLAEIDAMPPVKAEGHDFIEKNCLKTKLELLPSAQPEITFESAIDYLHSIGWMQNHDRILTESAQPEIIRCKDCKHFAGEGMYCSCNIIVQFDHFYCYHAERRDDG